MSNSYKKQCPDGAVCNHDCESRCFRVDNCGPLSGVYPDDEWPSEMSAEEVQPIPVEICVVCELPIEDGHMRGMGDGSGNQFAHEVCYWRARAEKWEAAYHDNKTIGDFTSELQDRAAMTDNIEHLKAKLEEVGASGDPREQARAMLEESVRMALEKNLELRSAKVVELEKERDVLMKAARMSQSDRMDQDAELITLRKKFDHLESVLCTEIDRGAGWQKTINDLQAANKSLSTNLKNAREECRKEVARKTKELRKANKDLGDALDAVRSSDEILEIEPGGIYKVHLNVKHRIEQLEAECFSLAAGVCPVDGGLVVGEGGTSFCTLARRQEGDLGKIVSWAAGEFCQSPVAGDVRMEDCRECAPCLAKEIKERAH